MAKTIPPTEKKELATVASGTMVVDRLPEFMELAATDKRSASMGEVMATPIRPPRIKIIQGQAKQPFCDLFKAGDLCAVPMLRPIFQGWERNNDNHAFNFTPVFYYREWVSWNPYGTDLKPVIDRSFDAKSAIACKSRDPSKRKEPCIERPVLPDGKPAFISHLEHLNFVIMIHNPNDMADIPIVMTFASGEHVHGTSFLTLIRQRQSQALFGLNFAAKVGFRQNKVGTWYGITVDNPITCAPYVQSKEEFDRLGSIYEEYQAYHNEQRLQTDYDDGDTVEGAVASPKTETRY